MLLCEGCHGRKKALAEFSNVIGSSIINNMSEARLDINEYDEAGSLVKTYIQSFSKRSDGHVARVDVVVSSLLAFNQVPHLQDA